MSVYQSIRRTIVGALAVLAVTALALTVGPALAADPVFPTSSRVGLVPPAGFVPSTRFAGFENQQANAAILLLTMPNEAYAEVEKNFTNEALKSLGIEVVTREAMTFKDGKGVFVAGPMEQAGSKRYESRMIANLSGVTALVSVQMLDSSRATVTDAMVMDALKTLAVRPQVPEAERLAILPYKVGELSGFHVVISSHDGTAVLTLGPKDATEKVEQPFVLMSVVTGEAPKPDERDKIARQAFGSAPGIKDIKITRSEPLRIGQSQGHEIIADAKDATSNVDVTAVQWLRFGTNAHLKIFAIAKKSDWNAVYPKLRAIRDSIEPRS
jgi:hypothetical protein